ncbi:protein of unknown function DUF477 [Cyanobacterium stanieri PCC 7202]|uniref:TPM domain-containing protein n=1 Tax=Cyanobacterium stanieri (strain ATCC 29140 / PCC 7202) TaxID=292563 RepID=K9YIS5_CYASC|nr:protein of unknown function DUF477 [Cyanobacterium stanieri PCC 7202]
MKIKLLSRSVLLSLLFSLSLFLFPLISYSLTPQEVPNPQAIYGGWVTDMANVLSDNSRNTLNREISNLEAEKGVEIAIVTVDSTQTRATPKEFTTELFNHWGIGKAQIDNGILFLVSMGDRRVEIETGYGMEGILPDARVGNIIDNQIIPNFREGNYEKGILDGTMAIIEAINVSYEFETLDVNSRLYSPNYFLPLLTLLISVGSGFVINKEKKKLDQPIYLRKDTTSRVSVTEKYPSSILLSFFNFIATLGLGLVINFLVLNSIFQSSLHFNLYNSFEGIIADNVDRFFTSFQLIFILWCFFSFLFLLHLNLLVKNKEKEIKFYTIGYVVLFVFIFLYVNIVLHFILTEYPGTLLGGQQINTLLLVTAIISTVMLIIPAFIFTSSMIKSQQNRHKILLLLTSYGFSFIFNWLLLNVLMDIFPRQFLFSMVVISIVYFAIVEFMIVNKQDADINFQELKKVLISGLIFFGSFTVVIIGAIAFIFSGIQGEFSFSNWLNNCLLIINNIFSYVAMSLFNNQTLANQINFNNIPDIVVIFLAGVIALLGINIIYNFIHKFFPIKEKAHIRFYADESKDIALEKVPSEMVSPLLTKEEKVAQEIGSIEVEGWVSSQGKRKNYQREDLHIRIYTSTNSKFKSCPHCDELTMIETKQQVTPATTSSSGLERITTHCHCCGYEEIREKTIPMIVVSSYSSSGGGSSGSGGGGSFGGGSSGGGGAGGSW